MELSYDPERKSSTEMTYQKYVMTPQTFASVNQYQVSSSPKPDCNPFKQPNNFGNYFKTCQSPDAKWGALKNAPDATPHSQKTNMGVPCHSIWNNQTKRKGVVSYQR